MPARVLVVEDSATKRMLIRARLASAYYQVIEAETGERALELAAAERPDLVLLDVILPGMNGFEVCRRLRADPATDQLPVVMLTALGGRAERVRALELGADEFLSKPVDELTLLSRVASLTRMKTMMDELALRDAAAAGIGAAAIPGTVRLATFPDSRLLVVGARPRRRGRLARAVRAGVGCSVVETGPDGAAALARRGGIDGVLLDRALDGADPLRLGAHLRALPETRTSVLLLVVDRGAAELAARGLAVGFNDTVACPVDPVELVARVRLQLRRKRYADRLRDTARTSMLEAMTDPLTGAGNRRYASAHLEAAVGRCRAAGAPLTVMMLDLDRFKEVNDRYGHAAGDLVLAEFARRLRETVRGVDLVARMGGEEFVVVMPEAGVADAAVIAERVRLATAGQPFAVTGTGEDLPVTVSIGYAVLGPRETLPDLLLRADGALYKSKHAGRNRATLGEAA